MLGHFGRCLLLMLQFGNLERGLDSYSFSHLHPRLGYGFSLDTWVLRLDVLVLKYMRQYTILVVIVKSLSHLSLWHRFPNIDLMFLLVYNRIYGREMLASLHLEVSDFIEVQWNMRSYIDDTPTINYLFRLLLLSHRRHLRRILFHLGICSFVFLVTAIPFVLLIWGDLKDRGIYHCLRRLLPYILNNTFIAKCWWTATFRTMVQSLRIQIDFYTSIKDFPLDTACDTLRTRTLNVPVMIHIALTTSFRISFVKQLSSLLMPDDMAVFQLI